MEKFTILTSPFVSLPLENIDTDQIIPARFLKGTRREGLGKHLFHDWRFLPGGSPDPDFILNRPEAEGAKILVAGDNFGCGSSREHAPWALLDFGFRVVVSSSFADIFRNNALENGLLPVEVDAETLGELHRLAREEPGAALTVDLTARILALPGGRQVKFPVDLFHQRCLLEGFDSLGYLLGIQGEIEGYEKTHPPRVDTSRLG